MKDYRTHYVTTDDGVTLGATVHGQGPPLVLLQGAVGDGDLDWQDALRHLSGTFTCHLPSMRGRGLSGTHPDLSVPRLVDDVITYVESLGEPAILAGWSLGASLALIAASKSDAIGAVVPFEPAMMSLLDEQEAAVLSAAVAGLGQRLEAGELTAAVHAFLGWPFTTHEIATAEQAGYIEAASRYAPDLHAFLEQATAPDAAEIDETAALRGVSVPVLSVMGADTRSFFADSARFVAEHAPAANVHEIAGAAHAAPLTHPEEFARALTTFVSVVQQPA